MQLHTLRAALKRGLWHAAQTQLPGRRLRLASGPGLLCVLVLALVLSPVLVRKGLQTFQDRAFARSLAQERDAWHTERVQGWQRYGVESWQVSCVRPDVPAMERSHSRFGYNCVRERVEIERGRHLPSPLLDGQESWELVGYVPESLGEPLNAQGRPLRFSSKGNADGAEDMHLRGSRTEEPYYYVARARGLGHKEPILKHSSSVEKYARMYKLPPGLLFAVMQVESGGRHNLVSSRNAMGLMQVQPHTAGMEVGRFLARKRTGERPGEDADSEVHLPGVYMALADIEQNILYGASYLHLLDTVYFKGVKDKEARLLCVLAAYNIGPGRFKRLFGKTPEESVRQINSYSAMGLYEEIKLRYEHVDKYDYMDKVITLMLQYRKLGY